MIKNIIKAKKGILLTLKIVIGIASLWFFYYSFLDKTVTIEIDNINAEEFLEFYSDNITIGTNGQQGNDLYIKSRSRYFNFDCEVKYRVKRSN
jgi:hypothetical protein